jgi:hypothetical protein
LTITAGSKILFFIFAGGGSSQPKSTAATAVVKGQFANITAGELGNSYRERQRIHKWRKNLMSSSHYLHYLTEKAVSHEMDWIFLPHR